VTTRNFDALFAPKAIALVGASNQLGSVGEVLARNLFGGGFAGPILPVNPHEAAIRSAVNYHSVAELPVTPDLAVVATPAPSVPRLIAELGARGCRAAVVISAGFGEPGGPGAVTLRQQMLDAARPHLMRIVGPNCLGFLSPARGINASFAQLTPAAGDVAFVTQSGAVATTVLDWAAGRGFGFSHVVSVGDMSDVDFGDLLDHLALDPATRSILLYVETVTSARKFMSAARIASRVKPVIVVKAGRSESGARAALSHTGALAGSDAVYDAAFRRAGMLRVAALRELFDAAATLATGVQVAGDRLAILTNGGGLGVLAADALEQGGGRLAKLSEATLASLDRVLPKAWSRGDPIDILGDADGVRYDAALNIVGSGQEQDALLVMNCPTGVADSVEAADALLAAAPRCKTPVLAAWLGEATAGDARRRLRSGGLPVYETPDEAISAFLHLAAHRRNQQQLLETPPAGSAVSTGARDAGGAIIAKVLAEGRSLLTEPEAKGLLAAYGVPVVETLVAKNPAEAVEHARRIGGPVALKILSRDITHKTDVGGVRLDLADTAMVERAATEMLADVAAKAPQARIDGFTVQAMVRRPRALELLLGIGEDATFGPVLVFGHGGVAVEVRRDRAVALPPLNLSLAQEMIARTRVSKMLAGYRDVPPADGEAVAKVLVGLSELLIHAPEVVELDINPLLADDTGVIALDARVVVRPYAGAPEARLAIRPYPEDLSVRFALADGRSVQLRPIRPEDAPGLIEMVGRCHPDDARMGLFGSLQDLPVAMAARLSQIDYDREITLVATPEGENGRSEELLGLVRLLCDPNFESGEFAIMVRSDVQRRRLGRRLITEMLDVARVRGLSEVSGVVMSANGPMLDLARHLGGLVQGRAEAPGEFRIAFVLDAPHSLRSSP
jgi:acetyltransferase